MKSPARPTLVPELKCSNTESSTRFYRDVLGFTVMFERPEEGFAFIEREGAEIMLDSLTYDDSLWKVADFEKPYGRNISFQIQVSDADALYKNVKAAGHPIFCEMEERWYRKNNIYVGNRQFLVQDPDGYLLRFYQDIGDRTDIPKDVKRPIANPMKF